MHGSDTFNLPACYIRYMDHVCLPTTTPGKKTELKAGVKSGGGGGGGGNISDYVLLVVPYTSRGMPPRKTFGIFVL